MGGHWDAPRPGVEIDRVSATCFCMNKNDSITCAKVWEDGTLHWDDGDIWSRVHHQFEGNWSKAIISGNTLKWNEGEEVAITFLNETTLRMMYYDALPPHKPKMFTAQIQSDGALHWDDDAVWRRAVDKSVEVELPPWLSRRRRVRREQTLAVPTEQAGSMTREGPQAPAASSSKDKDASMAVAVRVPANATVPLSWEERLAEEDTCTCGSMELSSESSEAEPAAEIRNSTQDYCGVVTWFRGSFGWITCNSLPARFAGDPDVFVHKNDCEFRPRQHDRVRFFLMENDLGKPQALQVRLR